MLGKPLGEWLTVSIKFYGDATSRIFYVTATEYEVIIGDIMLEKGNIPSDWSPSTKDVQDNIENARQTELNAINDYISSLGEDIEELQDQIDNVVVSWFGEYKPSESTEPQLSWLDYPTDEERYKNN